MSCKFQVNWREDSTNTVLGRLTARGGSGSATGVNGEGNWLQQADISEITVKTYNLDSETPSTAVYEDTLTVSNVVLDTPVTTQVIWTQDSVGYNFIVDLPPAAFPDGDVTVRVEFKVTLADTSVFFGVYEGTVSGVHQS